MGQPPGCDLAVFFFGPLVLFLERMSFVGFCQGGRRIYFFPNSKWLGTSTPTSTTRRPSAPFCAPESGWPSRRSSPCARRRCHAQRPETKPPAFRGLFFPPLGFGGAFWFRRPGAFCCNRWFWFCFCPFPSLSCLS